MNKQLALRQLYRLLAGCLTLSGCWHDPTPPNDNTTDAYGWTAPLAVAGSERYYRIPASGDLGAWMTQHAVASLAVFDATGNLQSCGALSGETNHPLATMPQAIAAHVAPFDGSVCRNIIAACFKNQPCSVPDICSPQIVDLTGTTLEGLERPEQIVELAAGKFPPLPSCRDYRPEARRQCDAHDREAAEYSRRAVSRYTEAVEFLNNYGFVPGSAGGTPGAPSQAPSPAGNGLLISLDVPAANPMLMFRWNKPASLGRLGSATLTCFGAGSTFDRPFDVQGLSGASGETVQEFWPSCAGRSFRLTLKPAVDGLQLLGVSATAYRPKPYMTPEVPQFWFEAKGTPPYAVFLEPQHSGCGSILNVRETAALPRAADPDWPPAAVVAGTPVVHARAAWTRMLVSRSPWLPWLYWLLYVGGACAAGLLATLVRWVWLSRRGTPE